MATNLRLNERAAAAVRAEARRSGRSQQDVIRTAVDKYLHLDDAESDAERARRYLAKARPPVAPFRDIKPEERVPLPPGVKDSLELLDREDRF